MQLFPFKPFKAPTGDAGHHGDGHNGDDQMTPDGTESKLMKLGSQTFTPDGAGLSKFHKYIGDLATKNGAIEIDGQQIPVSSPIAKSAIMKTELKIQYPNLDDAQIEKIVDKTMSGVDPATATVAKSTTAKTAKSTTNGGGDHRTNNQDNGKPGGEKKKPQQYRGYGGNKGGQGRQPMAANR